MGARIDSNRSTGASSGTGLWPMSSRVAASIRSSRTYRVQRQFAVAAHGAPTVGTHRSQHVECIIVDVASIVAPIARCGRPHPRWHNDGENDVVDGKSVYPDPATCIKDCGKFSWDDPHAAVILQEL